jgi:hypothetical protein
MKGEREVASPVLIEHVGLRGEGGNPLTATEDPYKQ